MFILGFIYVHNKVDKKLLMDSVTPLFQYYCSHPAPCKVTVPESLRFVNNTFDQNWEKITCHYPIINGGHFYHYDLIQISDLTCHSFFTHFLILYKVCSSLYMRGRDFACLCCYAGVTIAVAVLRDDE
jgi:hypothetical protein